MLKEGHPKGFPRMSGLLLKGIWAVNNLPFVLIVEFFAFLKLIFQTTVLHQTFFEAQRLWFLGKA